MNSGLIKNTEQALNTLDVTSKTLDYLGEKNYLDLATISDFGITPQDFLSRVLSNDTQSFELLGNILKNQENVPKR